MIEPVPQPVMEILARRARMTEGQLYTAVLAVLLALLLTLTGLPSAHRTAPATSADSPSATLTGAAP